MVTEQVLNNGVAGVMDDEATCFLSEMDSLACNLDLEGSATETMITYKRRKSGNSRSEFRLPQFQKLSSASVSQSEDEMAKEAVDIGLLKSSHEQVLDPRVNCHSLLNTSDDCSHNQNNDLHNMCELVSEDESKMQATEGLHCVSNPKTESVQVAKGGESLECLCHARLASTTSRISSNVEGNAILNADEPLTQSKNLNITKQCYYAFRRIVMSEKFASLHKLIAESFHGVEADKVLDFSLLKAKLKEGLYEQSPACFSSDIQMNWRKLHVVGSEMVSLSKSLSELSRLFCREVGGHMEHCTLDDKRQELSGSSSDWADRWKQPDEFVASTCGECRKKSDGRDCLVCDSCEELFHVSCIRPPVTEIPPMNWYCANCTALGLESRHEDCIVCENLHNPTGTSEFGGEKVSSLEEVIDDELEESSACIAGNGFQTFKRHKRVHCKVCKSMLERNELFLVCEHPLCKNYYHVRCLSNKQLKSYCPRWYCPGCLCRVCLTDKDDDKIVLCDACDHGYHIYCMNPPQDSIPEGKWFCRKCDLGLKAIHKAKMAYKSHEEKQSGRIEERRRKVCGWRGRKPKQQVDVVEKVAYRSGGVEMLLSAADAISCQEQMAGRCPELNIPMKHII